MNIPTANIKKNRRQKKWNTSTLIARVLWSVAHPLFRFSPRIFWFWRVWMLKLFGAKLGRNVHVYPTASINMPWNLVLGNEVAIGDGAKIYALGKIIIGHRSTISQFAHLCAGTHDYRSEFRTLLTPPIIIGQDVWVAADAFIMPGVSIGDKSVVGARAVVAKDVGPRTVVVGNPAIVIKSD